MEEEKLRLFINYRIRSTRGLKYPLVVVLLVVLLSSATLLASPIRAYVFVSFSMPNTLLEDVLTDASRRHTPAILNGLVHNSMKETAEKIFTLSQTIPDLELQIDPTLFERFNIHQIPALVVERGRLFDVIYGNLTIQEELSRIGRTGDIHVTADEIKVLTHG